MIKRFIRVNKDLYRGGAPGVDDVFILRKKFGINKIVSLDQGAGDKINEICEKLGIEHIIIPLEFSNLEPIAKLLSYNLYNLLMKNGPTFVHCLEGKDRTGMVIAMFKCQYMYWPCAKAIKEAKHLGFGVGLDSRTVKLYEKIIHKCCARKHDHKGNEDTNSADIVNNERWDSETMIGNSEFKSFAPLMDPNDVYGYNYNYDQFPTRENVITKQDYNDKTPSSGNQIPLVGLYDNNSGVKGVAPVDNGGGYVST
jgi:hypothetical protein